MCCSPWGHKESDMTEQLNHTELKEMKEVVREPGGDKQRLGSPSLKGKSLEREEAEGKKLLVHLT